MAINLKGLRKEISWMTETSIRSSIKTFRSQIAKGLGNIEDHRIMLRELEAEAIKRGYRID